MERTELAQVLRHRILEAASLPAEGEGAQTPLQNLGGDWLVCSRDPVQFRSAFALACSAPSGRVVLCDPGWGHRERAQLATLLARSRQAAERGWLCIPTGGSSGVLKLARHDASTVSAAVQGFRLHFCLDQVKALGLLPLYHVSGFMAWLRCELSGGSMVDADWWEVEAGRLPEGVDGLVLSLVPTQLQRLLREPASADWLRRFEIVFVGGAPAWPSLLDNAQAAGVRVSTGYGMTETAAMVCALQPTAFGVGVRGVGLALPHARLSLDAEGVIRIEGSSLFYGYTGSPDEGPVLVTEDLGQLDAAGLLQVQGRRDAMIITGGKKVAPAEVEAAILGGGHVDEVAVLGLPDAEWGQAVCACVPARLSKEAIAAAIEALEPELAPYKRPKRWIQLTEWPRDEKGKLNRSLLRMLLRPHGAEERG